MNDQTDGQLLERWRGGDPRAGPALLDRYFPGVHRFFRATFPQDVDDLTQRTFLALLESRHSIREAGRVRAFVFTIARRVLAARLSVKLRRHGETVCANPGLDSVAQSAGYSPSEIAVRRQDSRLLVRGLRQLPVDDQIAIMLRYWEQVPLAEIAAVLGTSHTACKSRLARARTRLGALMRQSAAAGLAAVSTNDNTTAWSRRVSAQTSA